MSFLHHSSNAQESPKKPDFTYNQSEDRASFNFAGSSTINQRALQLTPDSENQVDGHNKKSGRILYKKSFELWSSSPSAINDSKIASFSTFFVLNNYLEKNWTNAGEGMAFLIAPDFNFLEQSYGQWLGLTNETTNGKRENRFVAIEFDTRKQEYDPDDNHIGLNINSVNSTKTVSIRDFRIARSEVYNYNIWIKYNETNKILEVYIADWNASDRSPKPETPLIREKLNLKDVVERVSYFGFSGSTGDPGIQYNCVLYWELSVDVLPTKKDWKWVIVGVGVGVLAMVLVLVLCGVKLRVFYLKKKKSREEENTYVLGNLKNLPGMPRKFRYRDLKKATNSFHESMILGKGGFGIVRIGVLVGEKGDTSAATQVAVKKFLRDDITGKDDFLVELTIIHRLRHKNLVRLGGATKKRSYSWYDFMPNGSVEKHLYNPPGNQNTLNWNRRCNVLAGVASALHYLHNDFDQKVVHRDLKASNILLDTNYNARLGDFGLARAIENEKNSYAEQELGGVPGTMGYVAPECFHTGKATPESDVFGFGAVVLEVVCGRRLGVKITQEDNQYTLVDWVWMLNREGRIEETVDERLRNDYDVEEARRLLLLGLACSHPNASERPQTRDISQIISKTLPPPRVPPFKPTFTWPSMPDASTFSSISSSFSTVTLPSS
ncbi:hypothetical protein UlMin_032036 [Ulmus minor]